MIGFSLLSLPTDCPFLDPVFTSQEHVTYLPLLHTCVCLRVVSPIGLSTPAGGQLLGVCLLKCKEVLTANNKTAMMSGVSKDSMEDEA